MPSIDQLYERLGITALQAEVLIALMQNGGTATVPEIISTLMVDQKVNRTSIYSVLKKLVNINLVLTSEHPEMRSIKYTLVSKSPQQLVDMLIEPNTVIVNDLTQKLQKAKLIASKSGIETEFYSLKNLEQIKRQIGSVITESNDYVLIMANSLVLKQLLPLITEKKKKSPNVDIVIQPTGNPDQNIDFNFLLDEFRSLLGVDNVSNPLRIFSQIGKFSKPLMIEYMKGVAKGDPNMLSIINKIHFVQILTDRSMIISTYFDHERLQSQSVSGLYSKEQFISQNHIVIYFSIFMDHHQEFKEDLMERVIMKRMRASFGSIRTMLMS